MAKGTDPVAAEIILRLREQDPRLKFIRAVEPEQCPDCGKYAVRPANEVEQQEYKKHVKEF